MRIQSLLVRMFCYVWLLIPTSLQGQYIPDVKAKASSEQVAKLFGAENLVNNHGLKETAPGSQQFQLTTNGYADGGSMWHSGYREFGPDETPWVEFDLQKSYVLGGMHVWNYNGQPSRGIREATLFYSTDGNNWQTYPNTFQFPIAPQKETYTGQFHPIDLPFSARYIRLLAHSTYRSGGQPDLAGLGKVRFIPSTKPAMSVTQSKELFPDDAGVVNVKLAPYNAKGDGITDDTTAIQQAIQDTEGTRKTLYLPAGNYLVSKSLRYRCAYRFGHSVFRGESKEKTKLVLKAGTFQDVKNPVAVLFNGYNGAEGKGRVSADWFQNFFTNFSVVVEANNPGAIGIQFYSNNTGCLRDVEVIAKDGQGLLGIDFSHADQNGPFLGKNLSVQGFQFGIKAGATVNSLTLENIRIQNYKEIGLENGGQCISIRNIQANGTGPAVINRFGVMTLMDAKLTGENLKRDAVAITNGEVLFAREITIKGFTKSIANVGKGGTPEATDPRIKEYVSHPVLQFGSANQSLNLPVQDTPVFPVDPAKNWANVLHYRQMQDVDDGPAIQRAIDSGAKTLYFPSSHIYRYHESILIRGNVQQLVGMSSRLMPYAGKKKGDAKLVVEKGNPAPLFVDQFSSIKLENRSDRQLIIRDSGAELETIASKGDVYLEDVVGEFEFGKHNVWARQLNAERQGVHISNQGGKLWILGLKTERGGSLIVTEAGGKTEVLGGLCYTTSQGKLAPMFLTKDSELSVTMGEVCYTGDPFKDLLRSEFPGKTYAIKRGEAPFRPSFLHGSVLPLLRVSE